MILNGRRLRTLGCLGEGGFSVVYLMEDTSSGEQYALKKMTAHGEEHLEDCLREAELHTLFDHPNLLKVIDYGAVAIGGRTTRRSDGVNLIGGGRGHGVADAEQAAVLLLLPYHRGGSLFELLGHMTANATRFAETEALALFVSVCTGVRELHHHQPPLAHRDIKPGNILLNDNNCPLLMDFGSMRPARVDVQSRSQALALADEAAGNSTAPYRAPELFDVSSNGKVDERTDIWSLGCLLYAIAFGCSPFEASAGHTGGSIALSVMSGRVTFPENPRFSQRFLDLILLMLNTDMDERPFIDDVIDTARAILRDELDPNYTPRLSPLDVDADADEGEFDDTRGLDSTRHAQFEDDVSDENAFGEFALEFGGDA